MVRIAVKMCETGEKGRLGYLEPDGPDCLDLLCLSQIWFLMQAQFSLFLLMMALKDRRVMVQIRACFSVDCQAE